ncbi:c-type cytochrome [Varunaivibrio sulfuroxidans]|uniref:Cytochrome c556 n=1 Tax=Varunaivibrio sulfuroxidans TaxID=1773489 RepID=A0A4R3JCP2_9PROT|nr:cytochrome c [Varunaivibrio sulfuroxidans]TCS62946.1 cytochrome c556 [Varunaivibrio sulfuroxidans]WES31978.1 cytochrome c [Varunaivibrio sulfuroxidans]
MKIRIVTFAILAVSALSIGAATFARADDAGEIAYRKAVMSSIGGHMAAMATIIKKAGGQPADLAVHADGIAALSKIAGHIFPEGSEFGDTAALPAIWDKPDEFKKALSAFQTAAAHLSKVADGGDMQAFGPAFGGLAKACKGCHENFREKKQ